MSSQSLDSTRQLSYRDIFVFWFPLGLMWLMMAVEQPALNAVMARLADAERNLAAFGVVWAISLVIESPVIQMLAAATAVADSRDNYRLLLRFMHVMGLGLTALHLVIGLTPLYDLIVSGLLNVPPEITELSRVPFIIMAPFAAAVGYRRLWQGALIRHGKTWIVPVTMLSRLLTMAVVLAIGFAVKTVSGAVLGAIAQSIAVVSATAASGILNRILVRPKLDKEKTTDPYTWSRLLRFYIPLSMTTIVFLASQPMVTFGIARGMAPVKSLAVFPVVNAFLFLFTSIGMSYQEAAIALLNRSPRSFPRLSRFSVALSLVLTAGMLAAGLTPAGTWWFRTISGLGDSLMPLTFTPVLIMAIIPFLATTKAWYRARYVAADRTNVLAYAVIAYTIILFVAVLLGSSFLPFAGVTVAAIALAVAQAAENGVLLVGRPGRPAGATEPANG